MELNKVYNEDCVVGMQRIEDNSVDSIVTDGPYGIRFMGRKWDYLLPSVGIWQECLRILKPGGHILAACGTRTQHRMAVNIEDAGFEIRDVITWHYGSGFPKSLDVSKAIDKRGNRLYESTITLKNRLNKLREDAGISKNKMSDLCGFEARNFFRIDNHLISVFPDKEKWEIIKKILGCGNGLDKLFENAEREIIGSKKTNLTVYQAIGQTNTSGLVDITAPSTDEAQQWEGWGTSLKPATEFWTLGRKPLSESTIAENIIKHGTGGINIDDCRIETTDKLGGGGQSGAVSSVDGWDRPWMHDPEALKKHADKINRNVEKAENLGRFPANLILDDFAAALLDEQTGILKSGSLKPLDTKKKNAVFGTYNKANINPFEASSGGASRFFYVAKPSKAERGEGNTHETVKPIKLMKYLVKLITPPGGTTVDPFAGSGTTVVACIDMGFNYIAFEREEKYYEIIQNRIIKHLLADLY